MSELTKCLATPFDFIWRDKTYKVSPITQNIKAKFEQKIYGEALNGAAQMKKILKPDEYIDFLQTLNDRHTGGFFSWSNPKWLQTTRGAVILACLCWDIDEETLDQMAREKTPEMRAVFRKILQEASGATDEQMEELDAKLDEELNKDKVITNETAIDS